MCPHPTNGWLVVGYTETFNSPPEKEGRRSSGFRKDLIALRIDTSGSLLWVFQYGLENNDYIGVSAVYDNNGNFIVQANTIDHATNNSKMVLFKLNSSGAPVWMNNYSPPIAIHNRN